MIYVDSSALLKRYVDEPDSDVADALLAGDPDLVTGRHTIVEVHRNLARLLDARQLAPIRAAFTTDVQSMALVELDAATCEAAATIAELTGVRTLDALHLGAAQRLGAPDITFLSFDLRQAQAARALGMHVVGV